MKVIQIKIADETYQVVQNFVKINLYQIFSKQGIFEITRNHTSGQWKILTQDGAAAALPLIHLGHFIECNLGVVK